MALPEVARFVRVSPLRYDNVRFGRAFISWKTGTDVHGRFDPATSHLLPADLRRPRSIVLYVEIQAIDPARPAGAFGTRVFYQMRDDGPIRHADVWEWGVVLRPRLSPSSRPQLCDIATEPPWTAPLHLDSRYTPSPMA
jgi:hypothetical protein